MGLPNVLVTAINDLNALTDTFSGELFTAPGNVHFKTGGSEKLGDAAAAKLTETFSRCRRKRWHFVRARTARTVENSVA